MCVCVCVPATAEPKENLLKEAESDCFVFLLRFATSGSLSFPCFFFWSCGGWKTSVRQRQRNNGGRPMNGRKTEAERMASVSTMNVLDNHVQPNATRYPFPIPSFLEIYRSADSLNPRGHGRRGSLSEPCAKRLAIHFSFPFPSKKKQTNQQTNKRTQITASRSGARVAVASRMQEGKKK